MPQVPKQRKAYPTDIDFFLRGMVATKNYMW